MHLPPCLRSPLLAVLHGAVAFLPFAWCAAQNPLDIKTPAIPDPVKGPADPSLTAADPIEQMRSRRASLPHTATMAATATGRVLQQVLTDDVGDGRVIAIGNTWKASIGADGLTYVPYFGSDAPRNFPVHFQLRDVRVGGRPLPLADATPTRDGQRVVLDRGPVLERYDLRIEQVEQTFVVTTELAGDVDVVLSVDSELAEDAALPGLQFGNEFGHVAYGDAFVVDGAERVPVPTTFEDGLLVIHVPAAVRTAGPLVIDPLLTTNGVVHPGTHIDSEPEVAYDATNDQYLLVWHYEFSATDFDVYSEFCSGSGTVLTATFAVIDGSLVRYQRPHVANLNLADRFLVVMEKFENSRWQVVGRLQNANQSPSNGLIAISDPSFVGHAHTTDVGGDSATSPTADHWLVVWQREVSPTDSDIHGRIVRFDGALPASTILIENTTSTIYQRPIVSKSNGNGFTTAPRWMVVYENRLSPTDTDVYGCVINQSGTVATASSLIDGSSANDLGPKVTAPNTDFAGNNPLYLVTYERQAPLVARARLLNSSLAGVGVSTVDLTTSLGLGGHTVSAECDGNRFAVMTSSGIATLALAGTTLVVHDGPQPLPGAAGYPSLCSKRNGGGAPTAYGIVYIDLSQTPARPAFATYAGHVPGVGLTSQPIGCSGLGITGAGQPNLGETLTFALANVGADVPAFAFGTPITPSPLLCATCPLGVSPTGLILVVGTTFALAIPPTPSLVGFHGGVQGLAIGSGPCTAQLRFSDSFEFTVR